MRVTSSIFKSSVCSTKKLAIIISMNVTTFQNCWIIPFEIFCVFRLTFSSTLGLLVLVVKTKPVRCAAAGRRQTKQPRCNISVFLWFICRADGGEGTKEGNMK